MYCCQTCTRWNSTTATRHSLSTTHEVWARSSGLPCQAPGEQIGVRRLARGHLGRNPLQLDLDQLPSGPPAKPLHSELLLPLRTIPQVTHKNSIPAWMLQTVSGSLGQESKLSCPVEELGAVLVTLEGSRYKQNAARAGGVGVIGDLTIFLQRVTSQVHRSMHAALEPRRWVFLQHVIVSVRESHPFFLFKPVSEFPPCSQHKR